MRQVEKRVVDLLSLYMRLGKSVTCTSNAPLSKEKGLTHLEAVGVGVTDSLSSFSLEKHLLIQSSRRGASDKETSQTRSSPSVELPLAGRFLMQPTPVMCYYIL